MNTRTGGSVEDAEGPRTGVKLLRLLAALTLVNALILAPSWVLGGGIGPPLLALEGAVIVCVFAMLPSNRWSSLAAVLAAVSVTLVTIVGFGETAVRLSLGRSFNLYTDFWLLRSVWHLLIGMLGLGPSLAVALLALVGVAVLTGVVTYLLVPVYVERGGLFARVGALSVVTLVSMGLTGDRVPAITRVLAAPAVELTLEYTRLFAEAREERERFTVDLARSHRSYADLPGLLRKLEDRDVLLVFVESYGMVALDDPRYASVVGPRLDDLESRMASAGLHVVTGKLVAPSQGGQSWFGHGSLLSGLWLDNQMRYDMMLAASGETLVDDFERAGYRTVALMPAIILPWPEGQQIGYEEIFSHKDIEYEGPSLNWVTMPDQFSWSFLENTIRADADRPLFAEVGLISSHAPWTPILPVLDDWDTIGDGAVFAVFENDGERPEELWRDIERVREHYARSLDYAVHVMTAYAERYVDEHTLLIVLGDHQPAPLITGNGASWEVPVHVISGDPALLDPFVDWGFVSGGWPDPALETLGMDYFRDWFVRAYSGMAGGLFQSTGVPETNE